MLKKLKNKLLLFSLMGMVSANTFGCDNSTDSEFENTEITYTDEGIEEEKIDYTENIVENNDNLENIIDSDEGIVIEGVITYPDEEIITYSEEEVMNLIDSGDIQKVYYTTQDTTINIPSYLSNNNIEEYATLPKLECLEVYEQVDDMCLVKTNDYIGYVNTATLEELSGTFVVVDISDQELKLYSDNKVVLTSPVVTGSPSTPSDQGLFEIYDISGPRYLIGPDYKTYVDVMMKYNGNEGLHDAEYHAHEDGFGHGWRSLEEFGGDTYLNDGSHGCVNMPHDEVMMVKEYAEIGTKVLVKQ